MSKEEELRPAYYGQDVTDYMERTGIAEDFYHGNIIKYMKRAGHKPGEEKSKDLKKARTYLNMWIDYLVFEELTKELP